MKKKLKRIKNRIYEDYFMPSRLNEYKLFLIRLKEQEYKFITFRDYIKKFHNNSIDNNKYFIIRHDIDTDISTAKEFFEIEKKYGVKATYYFRLSTLGVDFMKEIESYGSEASYHFEEIATFAKENHIKSKDAILKEMPSIKKLFNKNFKTIESRLDFKMETVCSHGDFVNRKLNIINNEITKDITLRKELGILAETYDEDIMNSFDLYLSDGKYPTSYKAEDILDDCKDKITICMLTHPRKWRSSIYHNTKENIKRIYEDFIW